MNQLVRRLHVVDACAPINEAAIRQDRLDRAVRIAEQFARMHGALTLRAQMAHYGRPDAWTLWRIRTAFQNLGRQR